MSSRVCAALAVAAALVLTSCATSVSGHPSVLEPPTASSTHASPTARAHPHVRAAAASAHVAVHASLFEGDGRTYGVGMPIIVRFDKPVTDRTAFEHAAVVTLNGRPADGAWYWERRDPKSGVAMEAHYRERNYWPARSHLDVDLPISGRSAGPDRAFDDSLTLSMDIGAQHISTVYQAGSPHMDVRSDGVLVTRLPVSLGSADFATYRGVKVVEEFDRVQNMEGTPVPWSVRVTNSGEFVHAASWNGRIGSANTSHGCTNLTVPDAEWFYRFSRLGDVLVYPDASGSRMREWDGIGDWNVPWSVWLRGGAV